MNDKRPGDVDIDFIIELIWKMEDFSNNAETFPDSHYLTHIFDDVSMQVSQLIPIGSAEYDNLKKRIIELGEKFREASLLYSKACKELENRVLNMRLIVEDLSSISNRFKPPSEKAP